MNNNTSNKVAKAYGDGYSDGYKKAFLAKQKEFKENVQALARRAMDVWQENNSPLSETDNCVLFNSIVDTFRPYVEVGKVVRGKPVVLDENDILEDE